MEKAVSFKILNGLKRKKTFQQDKYVSKSLNNEEQGEQQRVHAKNYNP